MKILLIAILSFCAGAYSQQKTYVNNVFLHSYDGKDDLYAHTRWPLYRIIERVRDKYGWVIDYESGEYSNDQLAIDRHGDIRALVGTFHAVIPTPKINSLTQEKVYLKALLKQYNSTTGVKLAEPFYLLHKKNSKRFAFIGGWGGPPILDTIIRLPIQYRGIYETLRDIIHKVGIIRGVRFHIGGIISGGAAQYVTGSNHKEPARVLIWQLYDQMHYEQTYKVHYSELMHCFFLSIHSVYILFRTPSGAIHGIPVPRMKS